MWSEIANIREVIPPTAEPVSVSLVKQHCRLGGDPDVVEDWEALVLPTYIAAARRHAELVTGINLTDAVYEMRVTAFASRILLPASPVAEIVSISYLDEDGEDQEVDPALYVLDTAPWAPSIRLAYGVEWPAHRGAYGDEIAIRFHGPYGSTQDSPPRLAIPHDIQVAILMMAAHWFENREAVVIGTITADVPLAAMHILQLNRLSMGV